MFMGKSLYTVTIPWYTLGSKKYEFGEEVKKMRTQEEISNKVQQLMGILGDSREEDYYERWRLVEVDTIIWTLINRGLTRNELIERRYTLEEIVHVLNSAQRKNYRLIRSFLVEIKAVDWLLWNFSV